MGWGAGVGVRGQQGWRQGCDQDKTVGEEIVTIGDELIDVSWGLGVVVIGTVWEPGCGLADLFENIVDDMIGHERYRLVWGWGAVWERAGKDKVLDHDVSVQSCRLLQVH